MRGFIMSKAFSVMLVAATAAIASGLVLAAEKISPSQSVVNSDGIEMRVGAEWVSAPAVPERIFLDARTRPIVPAWKPGDPIREIPRRFDGDMRVINMRPDPVNPVTRQTDFLSELQRAFGAGIESRTFTTPLVNIEAQAFSGVSPPDPSGDVGGGFYVQSINGSGGATYVIYNTSDGSVAAGPFNMDGLGSGGSCASGFGDPIVVFDQIASRWLLTEFSSSGNNLCIYLSATSNPVTTTWMRYAFVPPSFPDYPKYGVWPDAYYVGANQSNAVYALDRTKMLAGQPATLQRFSVPTLSELGFQMLPPASINGIDLPPAGAPGLFLRQVDDELNNPGSNDPNHDRVELFTFHVDFTTPANSVLAGPIPIQIADFDRAFNVTPGGFGAIPQPGTTRTLDPLLEVIMFPVHYRAFGATETMTANFVTKVGANNQSAIRWFELRRTGGLANPWTLHQEGTYTPAGDPAPTNRWMGASAMDSAGNIALGYSIDRAVAPTLFPSLSYVGRQAGDPLNVMTTTETSLVTGGNFQGSNDRWGDYFQMSVDPSDGCTFWFTGEYIGATNWTTRVASFRFDACGSPTFTVSGTPLAQDVCAASPTPVALDPVTISVGSISGFSTPVNFGFGAGLPAGFGGSYTVTPVAPPGSTTANLTVNNSATPGLNVLTLRGSAGGTDRDLVLNATIATQAAPSPTLALPANNATDVSSMPTFSWTAGAQSNSYLIEIATDPAFSNIILSQTVSGTSYQPAAALPTNTQIYWRVSADNACGTAGPSSTFTFTTQAAPGDCSAGSFTNVVFSDNIENGTNGWTHSAASGTDSWAISTARSVSPTHSWFSNDPATVADQRLVSPTIALPGSLNGLNFQFQQFVDIENNGAAACYDGGVLEISVDGGAFTQIPNSQLLVGPYRGAVSGSFSNPLAGLQAWCGAALPFSRVVVDLASYAGHNAQFRFRLGSDTSQAREGWYIDDVKVQGCSASDLIFTDGFDPPPP
jgi:hypothetical protein